MNRDIFEGNWKQIKGKVKEQWGKLTDNDLTIINGKREQLVGKIQEKYGYVRDQAEREVAEFEKACSACGDAGDEDEAVAATSTPARSNLW